MAESRKKKLVNSRRELNRSRRQKKKREFRTWVPKAVIILMLVGCSLLLWTKKADFAAGIRQELRNRQLLTVKEVVVEGHYQTVKDDIVQQLEVDPGMLLFDADLSLMRGRVERLPYVQTAQVCRQWPDRLMVSVAERVPVAMVNLDGLYYVDCHGQIFKRVEQGEEVDLPVLTGLNTEMLQKNPEAGRAMLTLGLAMLGCWQGEDDYAQEGLSEIHLDDTFGLTIYTRRHAWQVELGLEAFGVKLQQWYKVVQYLGTEGNRAQRFDCRSSHAVVVGYQSAVQ